MILESFSVYLGWYFRWPVPEVKAGKEEEKPDLEQIMDRNKKKHRGSDAF